MGADSTPAGGSLAPSGHDGGAKRERWPSRVGFIIASVGAAVGLGNVWRFPYLNFKHGGGAFLIPYFLFLVVTGLPLMQTELALGRLFQKGDIEAFGTIHRRARGVGTISVIGGFGVVTYYSAIIAWAAYYCVASFVHPLPWAAEDCGLDLQCQADPERALPLPSADSYLLNTVLRYDTEAQSNGMSKTISGPLFGALLFTWIMAYFCIWKGVKSVNAAVKVTVILPWMLLVIMLIYNATLDGARDGVAAYIGKWDMAVLADGSAWADAAGQIFFTLGAALGIMTAYGSYAPSTTDVWADNNWIGYLNSGTSLVAGFVVFEILGNMALRQRETAAGSAELRLNLCNAALEEIDECAAFDCTVCGTADWVAGGACCGYVDTSTVAKQGVFLAFSVYPAAMQYLGSVGGHIMSILWFLMLWLLGIDSMFAMIEGFTTVVTDTPRFRHLRKEQLAFYTATVGFIASVAFVTDIGLGLLDIFDHYIVNYGLMVTGALEAYVVSWVWGWRETRERTGWWSAAVLTYGFTAAMLLGTVIGGSVHNAVPVGSNVGIGIAIYVFVAAVSVVVAFFMREDASQTLMQWLDVWVLAGTRNLRSTFKHNPAAWEQMLHILSYDLLIKYVCPPGLIAIFIIQVVADSTEYTSGYGDYPLWMQIVAGVCVLGVMVFSLVFFCFYPGFWDEAGFSDTVHKQEDVDPAGASLMDDKKETDPHARYIPKLSTNDGWGNEGGK